MKSFEKEQICEANFRAGGPYWHLYTPGNVTTAFLLSEDDCAFAMNTVYFAHQLTAGIRILAFELMSNHLHMLIEGDAESVCRFFASLRKKLARGLASDRIAVPDSFVMQLKAVEAYGELALELNDGDCITDEEAFSRTVKICNTIYPGIRIRDLDKTRKTEIARKLHYEIHCSNGQIRRVLGLSQFEVESLFPKTS